MRVQSRAYAGHALRESLRASYPTRLRGSRLSVVLIFVPDHDWMDPYAGDRSGPLELTLKDLFR